MRSVVEIVRKLGGVAATHELLAAGMTSHGLTAAVRAGTLIRPRQGWYLPSEVPEQVVRAVRVGGRLASLSAAASYGLAVPHAFPLHVHVSRESSRLRTEADRTVRLSDSTGETTVIHRDRVEPSTCSTRWRVSLLDCLFQVVKGESEDDAVACLDSALRRGVMDAIDFELLLRRLPRRLRRITRLVDDRSDGYSESIIRRKLARAGIETQLQVPVLHERWIDLLIGDRLALEVDGAGKYSRDMTPQAVARRVNSDRQRDAFLEALGYHVIRISYVMIMFDWPATLSMIQAVMDRGEHRAPPKSMRF